MIQTEDQVIQNRRALREIPDLTWPDLTRHGRVGNDTKAVRKAMNTALTDEQLGIDETVVENETHYLYQEDIDAPFNSRKLLESYLKKLKPMLKQTV